jgi:hypothetical protein
MAGSCSAAEKLHRIRLNSSVTVILETPKALSWILKGAGMLQEPVSAVHRFAARAAHGITVAKYSTGSGITYRQVNSSSTAGSCLPLRAHSTKTRKLHPRQKSWLSLA